MLSQSSNFKITPHVKICLWANPDQDHVFGWVEKKTKQLQYPDKSENLICIICFCLLDGSLQGLTYLAAQRIEGFMSVPGLG